jgi:hypothetical protein
VVIEFLWLVGLSASSRACDLKGEANTCSNKPRNEPIPRNYQISRAVTAWIGFRHAQAFWQPVT